MAEIRRGLTAALCGLSCWGCRPANGRHEQNLAECKPTTCYFLDVHLNTARPGLSWRRNHTLIDDHAQCAVDESTWQRYPQATASNYVTGIRDSLRCAITQWLVKWITVFGLEVIPVRGSY